MNDNLIAELEILKQHLIDIGDVHTNPNAIEVIDDAIEEINGKLIEIQ
jgi:hypothetical protein